MERRMFNCLNCQNPLRIDVPKVKLDTGKTNQPDNELNEHLHGSSINLMKMICDSQTPSDAPVCKALLQDMDSQIEQQENDVKAYKEYLTYLKEQHPSSKLADLKATLQNLTDEERNLEETLRSLMNDQTRLDDELTAKKQEVEKANAKSEDLWKKYRDNLRTIMDITEETQKVEAELKFAEMQHKRLSEANVLDICFHIDVVDGMAEINGLRLGRLPAKQVGWSEMNAAWGQVVLLIDVLFERLNIRHDQYEIVAQGSHSYIKQRRSKEIYTLHGSGTPFQNNNCVDNGIKKVLILVDFLQNELKKLCPEFHPRFKIQDEKIYDPNNFCYRAPMMLSDETRFTKAMSMLLLNLKEATVKYSALRPPA